MKSELRDLIEAYCSKASELTPRWSKALGFPLPMTNTARVGLDITQRGRTSDGLQYFKPGYGVALTFDGDEIAIDFGAKGE